MPARTLERAAASAIEDFEADVQDGRLTLVDALWRRMLDRAAALSAAHTGELGVRTLDVVHVATAEVLELTHFVSYDKRQLALAKRIGLRTTAP